jgi:predicted transcriptional regulator
MSDDQSAMANVSLIVSAFLDNDRNRVSPADLPALIQSVARSLANLANPEPEPVIQAAPAVSIRRSLTPDHMVCLNCGKAFKSLKRHLSADHDLTPEAYRAMWSLSKDYPMVAPMYAAARSELAKSMGLGRKAAPAPAPVPATKARKAAPVATPEPAPDPLSADAEWEAAAKPALAAVPVAADPAKARPHPKPSKAKPKSAPVAGDADT